MTDDPYASYNQSYQDWSGTTKTANWLSNPGAALDDLWGTLKDRQFKAPDVAGEALQRLTAPRPGESSGAYHPAGLPAPVGQLQQGPPQRFNVNLLGDGNPVMGLANSPIGQAFLGTPGQQRGGTVDVFGKPLATTPVNFQNFATYAREGTLSLITSALGHHYQQPAQPYAAPAGPQNNEDILTNLSQGDWGNVLDNVIDGVNKVGDVVNAPLVAFSDFMRDNAAQSRGQAIRDLVRTGGTIGDPIVRISSLWDQSRFNWQDITQKAIAQGISTTDMAAELWDLSPDVVARIQQNPNMSDEELNQLVKGQPFSYDPAVNLIAELGVTLAPMLAGGWALRGAGAALKGLGVLGKLGDLDLAKLGLLGRPVQTAERIGSWSLQKAWRAYSFRPVNLAATALGLNTKGIMLGGGIRFGEWALKQAAALSGNQDAVNMMDQWLWEMPLSNNPGLNLVDAFAVHPLHMAKEAVGAVKDSPVVRIFGRGDTIPTDKVTGRSLGTIRNISLPDLSSRLSERLGWDAPSLERAFNPDSPTELTAADLKNGLLYVAMQVVRDAHEAEGRFIAPDAGVIERNNAFWQRYGPEAVQLLQRELTGQGDAISTAIRDEFWTRSSLIESSDLGREGGIGPYDPAISLQRFVSWIRASKQFAGIADGANVPALREDINREFVDGFLADIRKRYKPGEPLSARDLNTLQTYVPAAARDESGLFRGRKRAPFATRRAVEGVLARLTSQADRTEAADIAPGTARVPVIKPEDVENPKAVALAFRLRQDTVGVLEDALAGTEPTGAVPPDLERVLTGLLPGVQEAHIRRDPGAYWPQAVEWYQRMKESAVARGDAQATLDRFGRHIDARTTNGTVDAEALRRVRDAIAHPYSAKEIAANPLLQNIVDQRDAELASFVDRVSGWLDSPLRKYNVRQIDGDRVMLEADGFGPADVALLESVIEKYSRSDVPVSPAVDATIMAPELHPLEKVEALQAATDAGLRLNAVQSRRLMELGNLTDTYGAMVSDVYGPGTPVTKAVIDKLTHEVASNQDELVGLREQLRGLAGLIDRGPSQQLSDDLTAFYQRAAGLGSTTVGAGGADWPNWQSLPIEPAGVIEATNEKARAAAIAAADRDVATKAAVFEELDRLAGRATSLVGKQLDAADFAFDEAHPAGSHPTKKEALSQARDMQAAGIATRIRKVGSRWHVESGQLTDEAVARRTAAAAAAPEPPPVPEPAPAAAVPEPAAAAAPPPAPPEAPLPSDATPAPFRVENGRRLAPEAFKPEPGYVYHVTRRRVADVVAEEGVAPRATPGNLSGAQQSWWSTGDPGLIGRYAQTDDAVVLRTARTDEFVAGHGADDTATIKASGVVTPDRVEYLAADGSWRPVTDLVSRQEDAVPSTPVQSAPQTAQEGQGAANARLGRPMFRGGGSADAGAVTPEIATSRAEAERQAAAASPNDSPDVWGDRYAEASIRRWTDAGANQERAFERPDEHIAQPYLHAAARSWLREYAQGVRPRFVVDVLDMGSNVIREVKAWYSDGTVRTDRGLLPVEAVLPATSKWVDAELAHRAAYKAAGWLQPADRSRLEAIRKRVGELVTEPDQPRPAPTAWNGPGTVIPEGGYTAQMQSGFSAALEHWIVSDRPGETSLLTKQTGLPGAPVFERMGATKGAWLDATPATPPPPIVEQINEQAAGEAQQHDAFAAAEAARQEAFRQHADHYEQARMIPAVEQAEQPIVGRMPMSERFTGRTQAPDIGDPVVIDGTKYKVRGYYPDGRIELSAAGPSWKRTPIVRTVDGSTGLEWDKAPGLWRPTKAAPPAAFRAEADLLRQFESTDFADAGAVERLAMSVEALQSPLADFIRPAMENYLGTAAEVEQELATLKRTGKSKDLEAMQALAGRLEVARSQLGEEMRTPQVHALVRYEDARQLMAEGKRPATAHLGGERDLAAARAGALDAADAATLDYIHRVRLAQDWRATVPEELQTDALRQAAADMKAAADAGEHGLIAQEAKDRWLTEYERIRDEEAARLTTIDMRSQSGRAGQRDPALVRHDLAQRDDAALREIAAAKGARKEVRRIAEEILAERASAAHTPPGTTQLSFGEGGAAPASPRDTFPTTGAFADPAAVVADWERMLAQDRAELANPATTAVRRRFLEDHIAESERNIATMRARITGTVPAPVEVTFLDPADNRTPIRSRVVLVDAADVLTSDQLGFPANLQPRSRTIRASSDAQIQSYARDLQPDKLLGTTEGASGMPVVTPEGAVLAGNGRTQAIRLASNDVFNRYRARIVADAPKYGFDVNVIDKMDRPMLVRELVGVDPTEQTRLAWQLNEMPIGDLAPSLASAITREDVRQLKIGDEQDLGQAVRSDVNRGAVARIIGHLPLDAQSRYFDPRTGLNEPGAQLVEGALLSKLLRADDRTLPTFEAARSVVFDAIEQGGEEMRRITNGVAEAAGQIVKAQERAEAGTIGPEILRFSDDLTPALARILSLRREGLNNEGVVRMLDNVTMFDEASINPIQTHIAKVLAASGSQKEIRTFMRAVARAADAGDAGVMPMFEEVRTDYTGVLNDGLRAWNKLREEAGRPQMDPFPNEAYPYDIPLAEGRPNVEGSSLPAPTLSQPLAAEEVAPAVAARTLGEPVHAVAHTIEDLPAGGSFTLLDPHEQALAEAIAADPEAAQLELVDALETARAYEGLTNGQGLAGYHEQLLAAANDGTIRPADWWVLRQISGGLVRKSADGRYNMALAEHGDPALSRWGTIEAGIAPLVDKVRGMTPERPLDAATVVAPHPQQPIDRATLEQHVGADVYDVAPPEADAIAETPGHVVTTNESPALERAVRKRIGAPDSAGGTRRILEFNAPDAAKQAERLSALRQQALAKLEEAQRARTDVEAAPIEPSQAASVFPDEQLRGMWDRLMRSGVDQIASAIGSAEPRSLIQLADAVESIDRGMYFDPKTGVGLTEAEAAELRSYMLRVLNGSVETALARRGGRAVDRFAARVKPPDDFAKDELQRRAKLIMDDISQRIVRDPNASPLEGWEGTQYVPSPLPTISKASPGTPLTPRLLYRDAFANDVIPGLDEELRVGRMESVARRVQTARVSRVIDHIVGPRPEKAIRAQAIANFKAELARATDAEAMPTAEAAKIDKVAERAFEKWRDYIETTKLGGYQIYRRINLMGPERMDALFREAVDEIYNGKSPTWVNDMANAGVTPSKMWRRADNRLRQYILGSGMPLSQGLEALYGKVANLGERPGRWTTVTYHVMRFLGDLRWMGLEAVEPALLTVASGGIRPVAEASALTRRFVKGKEPIGIGRDVQQAMWREYAHWAAAVSDTAQSSGVRMRYLMRELARRQQRPFRDAVLEMAQREPELAKTIREQGDTAAGYVARLDRDWALAEQGTKVFGTAAEAQRAFKPWLDGGFIDKATYDEYVRARRYTSHPAIEAELAKTVGDPLAQALYTRLAQINHDLFHDLTETMFGQADRSNLQRLVNHPFLYWPVSYQIKATKWLLRFMLDESFGVDTGAATGALIQQAWNHQKQLLATNPEYAKKLQANSTLFFIASMLLPITPTDIGVSLSPWTRMLTDPEYTRQFGVFGWGPFYTYGSLVPRLIGEQVKAGGALENAPFADKLRQAFPQQITVGGPKKAPTSTIDQQNQLIAGPSPVPLPVQQPEYPRLP